MSASFDFAFSFLFLFFCLFCETYMNIFIFIVLFLVEAMSREKGQFLLQTVILVAKQVIVYFSLDKE